MIAILNTLETDNSINRRGGTVWNRLHSEREDICEALLKECEPVFESWESKTSSKEEATKTALWHRELLQSRLRKIDDALDRLMSGSYGSCCKCGRWIEDTKLDFDPAIAFCLECWRRLQDRASTGQPTILNNDEQKESVPSCSLLENLVAVNPLLEGVALETLEPFDTIYVQTLNSDYRIFLLDPITGRALIDGGRHFPEPIEVTITGSSFGGSTFKRGWIGIGLRLEFLANGKLGSTSPVQSFRVEHSAVAESASEITHVIQ